MKYVMAFVGGFIDGASFVIESAFRAFNDYIEWIDEQVAKNK